VHREKNKTPALGEAVWESEMAGGASDREGFIEDVVSVSTPFLSATWSNEGVVSQGQVETYGGRKG